MEVKEFRGGETPGAQVSSLESIRRVVEHVRQVGERFQGSVDVQKLREIVEEISPKLKEVGLFMSFERVGDVPVIKIKDVSGKVVKVFPKEEIAELMHRVRLFFDVLVELLMSARV